MYKSLVILGRQPALGLAELESLYRADAIESVHQNAAVLAMPAKDIEFARLGGVMKLCSLLGSVDSVEWSEVHDYLSDHIEEFTRDAPDGKLILGISLYGLKAGPKTVNATGLALKKQLKSAGRSCRVIPNKSVALNSAQVLYNKLTSQKGCELVLVKSGGQALVARTVAEQDIDAYAARDQARPARDAKVGMLPPKLAQTLVNLAVSDTNPQHGAVVLDPFCGTGVVLQEATLMGFDIFGTDNNERMVQYAQENMDWLAKQPWSPVQKLTENSHIGQITFGDATEFTWEPAPNFIACETYLGRPFGSLPDHETLNKIIQDVDTIHKKFLQNVARQTNPGFRMCFAVPAWAIQNSKHITHNSQSFLHLPVLERLPEMGYTRLVFKHAEQEDLIYHREGQVVARELIVLVRN